MPKMADRNSRLGTHLPVNLHKSRQISTYSVKFDLHTTGPSDKNAATNGRLTDHRWGTDDEK